MGLYDGISSCAKIADLLKIPILLVVDASTSSESVAAQALGFIKHASFTPYKLTIAGVMANRVGSEKHAKKHSRSLKAIKVPLIGTIEREASRIPSRHLGLCMGAETSLSASALKSIYDSSISSSSNAQQRSSRSTDRRSYTERAKR
jgi:cobyrinic acid a,c-diamide synthase